MFVGIGFSGSKGGDKPFSPAIVSGLQLWLDAEYGVLDGFGNPVVSDGQAVSTWMDKSGRNCHAVQTTEIKKPIYRTGVNGRAGRPALQWTSANATAMFTGNINQSQISIFIVTTGPQGVNQFFYVTGNADTNQNSNTFGTLLVRANNVGSVPNLIGVDRKGTNAQMKVGVREWRPTTNALTAPQSGWYMFAHKGDGTSNTLGGFWVGHWLFSQGSFLPKSSELNGSPGTTPLTIPVALGCDSAGAGSMDGKISEVLIYNKSLGEVEHKLVEKYLAAKYAFNLPVGH